MQVGILQAYFAEQNAGGGARHTERLAHHLVSRGHGVTVFTDAPDTPRPGIEDVDVRTYRTPAKLNPINELSLAERARAELRDCDVVVLTDDSAWRGVDLPVPTVMVFHTVWHGWVATQEPLWRVLREKPQALVYRRLERKICRKADRIVAISPPIQADLARAGAEPEKVVHIPNGVDTERFRPRPGCPAPFTVHYQGRLVETKNPLALVEAAARSTADWRLTIGGDGPLRERIERRVDRHGLGDRVDVLGFVPRADLPTRYARSHVCALPSTYEGMPLTVLEAAACGTPVVATPRAATDFVTAETGRVVDADPAALARTFDALARTPERAERMGDRARARAESYTWAEMTDQYEALFHELVDAERPSPAPRLADGRDAEGA